MKKFTILFFVFINSILFSQFRNGGGKEWNLQDFDQQKYSWGYYLGVNRLDFRIHADDRGLNSGNRTLVTQDNPIGFSVGLIGKMRLNEYLDLRTEPGLHFGERTLYFGNIIGAQDSTRTIKTTYLDIPILLNFHGSRWANKRPYVQAGVGYAINLQSKENSEQDNADGIFRMKTHNFNWQAEFGVELYFKKFKLTPAVKGIFFFNNELVQDNPATSEEWAGSLKSIHTRGVFFSLKFE